MNIENYFGMYIGSKIFYEKEKLICSLREVGKDHIHTERIDGIKVTDNLMAFGFKLPISDCKLILRPFSDMTEEEILTLAKLRIAETSYTISSAEITNCLLRVGYSGWTNGIWYDLRNELDMKQIEYLLEIGIDVFNLRERGWAVYESDITPTVKELGV